MTLWLAQVLVVVSMAVFLQRWYIFSSYSKQIGFREFRARVFFLYWNTILKHSLCYGLKL
ncbi:hypothetical protein CW733_07910 [Lacinutrix sp. Bg11-31]|nr:hypothetical protein CW733_07910 [Lacinutrix sp. Bg11-31]